MPKFGENLPQIQTINRLLALISENTGAKVFFVESEGWDWTVREKQLESDCYFPNPEEAIADMLDKLINSELPILHIGNDIDK